MCCFLQTEGAEINSTSIVLDPLQVASLVIIPFVIGACSSWLVAQYYYKKAKSDAFNLQWATRLDWLETMYKGFLVAVYNHGKLVPLYATLWWECTTREGKNMGSTFDGPDLFNFFNSRTPSCLIAMYYCDKPQRDATFGLTDYGKDCARYLMESEIEEAQLLECDLSHSVKLFEQYGRVRGMKSDGVVFNLVKYSIENI